MIKIDHSNIFYIEVFIFYFCTFHNRWCKCTVWINASTNQMWPWTRYIRVLSTPSSPDLLRMIARGHVHITVQNALVIYFRFWSTDSRLKYMPITSFLSIISVWIKPSFQVKGVWSFQVCEERNGPENLEWLRKMESTKIFVIYTNFHLL